MSQLITHYSLSEIILFVILLAVATKNLIQFVDWFKKRATQAVKEAQQPVQLACITKRHEEELRQIRADLVQLKQSINLLIESDKDDIKQSLTRDHHYFCYDLGSIDDYSLDCMEKRYSHYKDEGGNSFVKILMQEVRALPKENRKSNR